MAGEERLVVLALYVMNSVLPHAVDLFHVLAKDRKQDIVPAAEPMSTKSAAELKADIARKICGQGRLSDRDMESIAVATQLCYDAILDAVRHRDVCDGRRSLRTRQERALARAKAYISKWAQDRGLDFERIRHLRRKAGVA